MPARKLLAASVAIVTLALAGPPLSSAGEWLGGQYWGQVGGCANCGGSLYGGVLPPGAIWVGEIGWGGGLGCGCGCEMHIGGGKGDVGPIMSDEIVPTPSSNRPRTIPAEEIVPDPPQATNTRLPTISRRVSYIEAVEPAEREFQSRREQVRVVTHASQPERLQRAPIRIVSPDGSAGRMYR
jgi:hypothetical protein